MFQLRLLSFFQRIFLSFYGNMALALYYGASKRSSLHSSYLLVAKGCSPTVGSECVAVIEVARLNSENVASEKEKSGGSSRVIRDMR